MLFTDPNDNPAEPIESGLPRIGYVTIEDIRTWRKWPINEVGHISNAYTLASVIREQGFPLEYLGPMPMESDLFTHLKAKISGRIFGKRILKHVEPTMLQRQADNIVRKLSRVPVDVLVGNNSRPFAKLKTDLPIIVWRDATFAGALSVHRDFKNVSSRSIRLGHEMEKAALERCAITIFRSQWAADDAINHYGVDPAKVRILPTGGNMRSTRPRQFISDAIASRSPQCCELLFVGVDWKGKGGHVALEITRRLAHSGMNVRLTIVGARLKTSENLPANTRIEGFIDMQTTDGHLLFEKLLAESHFLIFPSRVDTYGNVLPEANAFGVPCLASDNAGIPTIIRNDINGHVFSLASDDEAAGYCDYIESMMTNHEQYRTLAHSTYNDYLTRLSWDVVGPQFRTIVQQVYENHHR